MQYDSLFEDKILIFPIDNADTKLKVKEILSFVKEKTGTINNIYICGGYAYLLYSGNENKDSDIDVFETGANSINRLFAFYEEKNDKAIDYIKTVHKTLDDVLLNFDIPVCRVAYDENNLYISQRALEAHLTKTYFHPEYFTNFRTYMDIIAIKYNRFDVNGYFTASKYFDKETERIEKYKSKGFTPIFVKYCTPTKWLTFQLDNFGFY